MHGTTCDIKPLDLVVMFFRRVGCMQVYAQKNTRECERNTVTVNPSTCKNGLHSNQSQSDDHLQWIDTYNHADPTFSNWHATSGFCRDVSMRNSRQLLAWWLLLNWTLMRKIHMMRRKVCECDNQFKRHPSSTCIQCLYWGSGESVASSRKKLADSFVPIWLAIARYWFRPLKVA